MPAGTTYGTVSFAAYLTDVDSPIDPDDLPELNALTGRVRILRSVPVTLFASAAPRPFTLFAGVHTYDLADGVMVDKDGRDAVTLVATDSPGGNPAGPGIVYVANFELDGGPARPPIVFELPGGTHVDLTNAAPVPAASPVGIVRGPGLASIGNPAGTTDLMFIWDDGVTVTIPMPPGTGVAQIPNGDHGDIIVADLGATLNIDPAVITPAARTILTGATIGDILVALGAVSDADLRLSDARAPEAHEHGQGDVTGLAADLTAIQTAAAALDTAVDSLTTDTAAALAGKAPLASPQFTGTPTAPTVKLTSGPPAAGQVWTAVDDSGAGSWTTPASAGSGIADGDYGDIQVTEAGTALNLDPAVVTSAARTVLDDADVEAMRATLGVPETGHTHPPQPSETLIVKSADESVTSSTVMQADNHLTFQADAAAEYLITATLWIWGPSTGDVKLRLAAPGDAAGDAAFQGPSTAAAFTEAAHMLTSFNQPLNGSSPVGMGGAGVTVAVLLRAYVRTVSAGTVGIWWAQNISDAGTTTVRRGSDLRFRKAA